MRRAHLDLLVCPDCFGSLSVDVDEAGSGDRITSGSLSCEVCDASYPIVKGIPRFVPESTYADGFGFQWHLHARTQHDRFSGTMISEDRFFAETKWPRSIPGETVLEVGSGSGRFTAQAITTGAMVVSMDLSTAVEVNAEIHRDVDNLLLIQADLRRPPLRPASFDRVVCLGVVQHTPDPSATFAALTRYVRPEGHLTVDVYDRREGLLGLIEPLYRTYYWFRPITRRMNPRTLYRIVDRYVRTLWPITRWIVRIPRIGRMINKVLLIHDYRDRFELSEERLQEWAVLDTFDNLSPMYDQRQTLTQVRRWFEEADFEDVEVHFGHNGIEGRGRRAADVAEPVAV